MRVKCLSWPLMKDTIAFNIKLQLFPVGDEALNCLYLTATYGDNLEEKGQVKRESSATERSMLPGSVWRRWVGKKDKQIVHDNKGNFK